MRIGMNMFSIIPGEGFHGSFLRRKWFLISVMPWRQRAVFLGMRGSQASVVLDFSIDI